MSKDIISNQIISIVGATATGKTALALNLARVLVNSGEVQSVHLLSADSRQVYKDLENLTGADLPENFTKQKNQQYIYPFFSDQSQKIFLHGISLIESHEEWSVAHFKKLFINIKQNLTKKDLLIVVGGTGFYQQQIGDESESIFIAQNKSLRESLEKLDLSALQNELKSIDENKYQSLNNSDLNNPRRLVRAIEVAVFKKENAGNLTKHEAGNQPKHNLVFCLELDKDLREQKINKRVVERFALAKKEVAQQLEKNTKQDLPAFSSTGFKELSKLIKKEIDQNTALQLWQQSEIQYAKRQDTWWKNKKNLIRIDATENLVIITDKIRQACYS